MLLYETSFEDFNESFEPPNGKYSRFGNLRVNLPGHSLIPYEPAGVRTGSRSIHVFAEKAWRWGETIMKSLPYPEIDMLTGDVLHDNRRLLFNIKDLYYNVYTGEPPVSRDIPDALFTDVLPDQVGRNHWEGDWTYYNPSTGYSWDNLDSLLEPRARIVNDQVGSLSSAFTRIYFKVMNVTGCTMQILRMWGGSDYIARVNVNLGSLRLIPYGRTWTPSPSLGDIDVPVSIELGKWYVVELGFVKGVNGRFQVWFGEDGKSYDLLIDEVADTSSAPDVSNFQSGMVDVFDHSWGQSYPYACVDVYFDDWLISTEHLTITPKHHGVITSTPVQGVPLVRRKIV